MRCTIVTLIVITSSCGGFGASGSVVPVNTNLSPALNIARAAAMGVDAPSGPKLPTNIGSVDKNQIPESESESGSGKGTPGAAEPQVAKPDHVNGDTTHVNGENSAAIAEQPVREGLSQLSIRNAILDPKDGPVNPADVVKLTGVCKVGKRDQTGSVRSKTYDLLRQTSRASRRSRGAITERGKKNKYGHNADGWRSVFGKIANKLRNKSLKKPIKGTVLGKTSTNLLPSRHDETSTRVAIVLDPATDPLDGKKLLEAAKEVQEEDPETIREGFLVDISKALGHESASAINKKPGSSDLQSSEHADQLMLSEADASINFVSALELMNQDALEKGYTSNEAIHNQAALLDALHSYSKEPLTSKKFDDAASVFEITPGEAREMVRPFIDALQTASPNGLGPDIVESAKTAC